MPSTDLPGSEPTESLFRKKQVQPLVQQQNVPQQQPSSTNTSNSRPQTKISQLLANKPKEYIANLCGFIFEALTKELVIETSLDLYKYERRQCFFHHQTTPNNQLTEQTGEVFPRINTSLLPSSHSHLECGNCKRKIANEAYAPHLERCMNSRRKGKPNGRGASHVVDYSEEALFGRDEEEEAEEAIKQSLHNMEPTPNNKRKRRASSTTDDEEYQFQEEDEEDEYQSRDEEDEEDDYQLFQEEKHSRKQQKATYKLRQTRSKKPKVRPQNATYSSDSSSIDDELLKLISSEEDEDDGETVVHHSAALPVADSMHHHGDYSSSDELMGFISD